MNDKSSKGIGKWLVGIAVAIAGIAVPIGWDLISSRSELEVRYGGATTLIESLGEVESVSIQFSEREIRSLSKLEFALINSGNAPILREDIVQPVLVHFSDSTRILEFNSGLSEPSGLALDGITNADSSAVILGFDLLNPGDYVQFSVMVEGPVSPTQLSGRVVGVKQIIYSEVVLGQDTNQRSASWVHYLVFAVSSFFFLIVWALIIDLGKIRERQRLLQKGKIQVNVSSNWEETATEVSTLLPGTNDSKSVLNFLSRLDPNAQLDNEQQQRVHSLIRTAVNDTSGVKGAIGFLFIMVIVGYWYSLSALL